MNTRITVTGGSLSDKEIGLYVDHLKKSHPGRNFESIDIKLDGDYVDLSYTLRFCWCLQDLLRSYLLR